MKSSLALSRTRRMQGRPYRLKPGTDPGITGLGSGTKNLPQIRRIRIIFNIFSKYCATHPD
jgi:hypothetical protein